MRCSARATRASATSPRWRAPARRRAGAAPAFFGVSPMHTLFPHDRERASPYHPSDRRFLDPILIDVLDPGCRATTHCAAALAALATGSRPRPRPESSTIRPSGRSSARRSRRSTRAFARARAARPGRSDLRRLRPFVAAGGEALAPLRHLRSDRRAARRRGLAPLARSRCATATRARSAPRRRANAERVRLRPLQPVARRPAARRRGRAGEAGGLEIGFYRDLAVGAAPDGAEAWARAGELRARRRRRRAARPVLDPGPDLEPAAARPARCGARTAGAASAALIAANMRHAGMLRIDHAMGLKRLFVIPDGAKPAEGAYLAYPLDDLLGLVALESQRARCVVVGEDLGTVPQGFREQLTRANILGMRVLWFEQSGARVHAARGLSAAVGRLRHDPRPADARRLVVGRGHRRASGARPDRPSPGGRRASSSGSTRSARSPTRSPAGLIAEPPDFAAPLDRRVRRRRPRAPRQRRLAVRQRPGRRPRRRADGDQPAGNRPRAPELAPQGRPDVEAAFAAREGARYPRGDGERPPVGEPRADKDHNALLPARTPLVSLGFPGSRETTA